MTRDELWKIALAHAGLTDSDAVWLELPGGDEDLGVDRNSARVFGVPAGEHFPAFVPGGEDVRRWGIENHTKIRVLQYEKPSGDAETLALMRWALEHARLAGKYPAAMRLCTAAHAAQEARIRALGPGGAVYHHQAPEQRQSNAAASAVVEKVLGPQTGKLNGHLGPLFRNAEDLQDDDLFNKRAVAFAAFHADDFPTTGIDVAWFLQQVDPKAEAWHTALLADDEFNALRGVAPVLAPKSEQTKVDTYAAPELWRPTADMLKRAEARALEILG